jgi:hypothetical protein
VQRVDYLKKTLRLVAERGTWDFKVDSESHLWFDDEPAVLRCFHPLDHVQILFVESNSINVIKAIYAWEQRLA